MLDVSGTLLLMHKALAVARYESKPCTCTHPFHPYN